MSVVLCPRCRAENPAGRSGPGPVPRCVRCRRPLTASPWSPAILGLADGHRVAGLAPPQRLIFALLVRTLQAYRSDRFMIVFGFVMMPFFAAVGFLLGLLMMTGGHLVLGAARGLAEVELGYALYAVPLFVLVFARWIKSQEKAREITFHREAGKVDGLELGRLHEIFETSEPSTLGLFLGICFGLQMGLLWFSPDHGGLPIAGGPRECGLLTLDNACHGIFLDTFELYNFHWGEKPAHTYRSATVFYAFRLAFDAFTLLAVYGGYRRYRLRGLFRGFPHDPRRLSDLLDWMETRCGDEHAWPRQYFDEFLFLMLAKDYLRGNLATVRQVSRQFPWLAISDEVRAAFIGPDGETTLRGRWASKS